MSTEEEEPQPPGAPEIDRKLRVNTWQWIGVPLLLLIPLLGLVGVFGETRDTARVRTAELSVEVEYPTRNRYRMQDDLRLDLTNTAAGPLDTVVVEVDTAYASRFSSVVAIPAFERPYVIELTDLEPGETRRVRVQMQGERYGQHGGELRVSAGGADTARVVLRTFIFP